jgi:plastocyanin
MKTRYPEIIVITIALLLAGAEIERSLFNKKLGSQNTEVVITKDGFLPKNIKIRAGDSVTFRSEVPSAWPASDPHPTHNTLSEFDPQKPILKNESWTHTFFSPGIWQYHDHLHPGLRGTIEVISNGQAYRLDAEEYCEGECFDIQVKKAVATKGIDAAYALFTEAYAAGKLPRTCHWTAHQIGEAAYELFRHGKEFPITQTTSYCGYGFYHGFLEHLLREDPDIDRVLAFCDEVKKQLGNMGLWNCIHGIGHGFTEDPPDPRLEGDADRMLEPGIRTCEFLFGKDFNQLNLCLTGVYTVIAGFASDGEYGLNMTENDPFAFCRTQPYRYQKACYGEFAPKLDKFLKGDISNLPSYVNAIEDQKLKDLVTWVVPSVSVARDILSGDLTSYATACKNGFSGNPKDICIGGVLLGIFSHGEPEKQYIRAFEFCDTSPLTDEEKESCYEETFHRLRQDYAINIVQDICKLAPEQYRKYCDKRINPPAYLDQVFE